MTHANLCATPHRDDIANEATISSSAFIARCKSIPRSLLSPISHHPPNTHIHNISHIYIHTYTHIHTLTNTHPYTYTHTHHTYTLTHKHTQRYTYVHRYTLTHSHTHKYTHSLFLPLQLAGNRRRRLASAAALASAQPANHIDHNMTVTILYSNVNEKTIISIIVHVESIVVWTCLSGAGFLSGQRPLTASGLDENGPRR